MHSYTEQVGLPAAKEESPVVAKAATVAVPRNLPRWRAVALLSLTLGVCSVSTPQHPVEAATIPTGTSPKDTAIRSDGAVSYVLNTGNSTLSVINVATAAVINTIPLAQPINSCSDIDWHPGLARVIVGCSNGNILSVDPTTGFVAVAAANPACAFNVICADTLTPGVLGWAIDGTAGRLYRIAGGLAIPSVLLGITTPVELVEKRRDPGAPSLLDANLYAVGNNALVVRVTPFNRTTGLAGVPANLGAVAATATGLATSAGSEAYVSVNAGGLGLLYQLSLAPLVFNIPALAAYGTAALDVSVAGSFAFVAVQAPAIGTHIYAYDIGDPSVVFAMGYSPFSPLNGVAGLSTWIGSTGTVDAVFCVLPQVGTTATCVGLDELQSSWTVVPSFGPTGWSQSLITPSFVWTPLQEFLCCLGCPPMNYSVSAGVNAGSSPSTASASGDSAGVSLGDPTCGGGGGGTRPTGEGGVFIDLPSTCGTKMGITIRGRREFDVGYGQGAFLSLDERLITQPSGDEIFYSGMGRVDTYVKQPGGGFSAPLGFDTTLVVSPTSKTVTDRFGTVSTFTLTGERTSVTTWTGRTTTYGYTGDRLDSVTDQFGRQITLNYATGSFRRLSSISDCCSKTWAFRYDYLNRLVAVRSPTSVDFPSGRTTSLSYMPNAVDTRVRNNLVEQRNPEGNVVLSLAYDSYDRVIKETIGTAQTAISYGTSGPTTTVIDLDGNTTEYTFNTAAEVISKKEFTKGLRVGEPASFDTSYSYNGDGFVATVVHPRGNRSDFTYTAFDLTEVRHRTANTSTNAASDIVHSYTYGAFHQRTGYTDPRGNFTAMVLDSVGNTIQVDHPTITTPTSQTIQDLYGYDSLGRLTSAIDGEGREITFEYYTSGPMDGWLKKMVRDPAGLALTTTFSYTSCGNVGTVTDPNGNVTTFTIDGEGYVTEITAPAPLGYKIRFTYDANRNVIMSETQNVDRTGAVDSTTPWIETVMTYDANGRLTSRRTRISPTVTATTSYEYSGAGRLTKITSPEGNVTTFEWDERGLLFKATRGFGTADASTVQLDYDENGNRIRVTDGRGAVTTLDFDLHDRVQKLTNALGHYATYAYDLSSNLLTVSRYDVSTAFMAETNRHFDEINRLWKTVDTKFQPGSGTITYPTTTYTRDRGHLLTNVQNPLGNSTSYAYDDARRLLTETDAASNVRALDYDSNSNVIRVSMTEAPAAGSPETFVTEFDFDVLNRRTTRREIDRTNSSNVFTSTYEFDSRGNLTFRTDAEGHPARWTYDLSSRLLQRERALSVSGSIDNFVSKIVEQFAYDKDNRLTSLTDDNARTTSYGFDALDRSTTSTFADTKSVATTFDENGNATTWTDQNGTVVTNTFDALNRLTARSVARGTGVLGTTAESYTYDALDRLLTAVDDDYQVQKTWDSVGNLVRDRQGYNISGNERWKDVDTAWDADGNQTSITYPSGFVVGHQRDAINRMTSLDDVGASTAIATFTWQGTSRIATTTNQNGTSTAFAYDGFARVATIDHRLPSNAGSLHKFEYLYDKVHSRRMEKNSFDATWVATLPSAVQTVLNGRTGKGDVFSYDWANRLVDARYDVANPATEVATPGSQTYAKLVAYTLDGLGNRSQVATTLPGPTTTTVTYAADVVNQYTTVGGVSRTHDDNGSVKNDGTHKFAYDYENHIVEARDSTTNALVATYAYDAFGRRVERAISGGATTRYVLDGVEVAEEYDGSNAWAAHYTYEDGIDEPRTMDRADVADVDGDANTTEVLRFTYHQSAMGSITELTQPGGAVVEWVTYDAYGAASIHNKAGGVLGRSSVGSPFLYTGREFDSETNTYYYRNRAYDAAVGRFMQRDPSGMHGGASLYEYALSNPATLVDPSGLAPFRVNIVYKGPAGGASKDPQKAAEAATKAAEVWKDKHKDDKEYKDNKDKVDKTIEKALEDIGKPHVDDKNATTDANTVPYIECRSKRVELDDEGHMGFEVTSTLLFIVQILPEGPTPDEADPDKVAHEKLHVDDAEKIPGEVNTAHEKERKVGLDVPAEDRAKTSQDVATKMDEDVAERVRAKEKAVHKDYGVDGSPGMSDAK